jgi:spore coat protein U-like protein
MTLNIWGISAKLLSMSAFVQASMAAAASASFPVNASILSACALGATGINFGEVGTAGATTSQTDSTGTITVTCTTGAAYSVTLGNGLHNVGVQRNVQSGSNALGYDLYKDPARDTVWTGAAAPVTGIGTAASQVITVYGRIAASLPLAASKGTSYADTVLVTLAY